MTAVPRYQLELSVRDYECDLQGVVNNAVYLHYLEHTRHEFLKTLGLDFAELSRRGCQLVLVRAEVDYRAPLRSGDRFLVSLALERPSKLRFLFAQEIVRLGDGKAILAARVTGTAVNDRGRPYLPPELAAALDPRAAARD